MGSKGCKLDYEGAICSCGYGCKYRDERIAILEAEVERLKKANQHWHDRQPERAAQLKLQEDFEEALDIILMTGVAPKFVEKHHK